MEDRDCVICGKPVDRTRNNEPMLTCSQRCATDYGIVRDMLDQERYEKHAHARAKTVLSKPENYPDEQVRWAKRMKAGEIELDVTKVRPRKGSKRWKVAKRIGLIE